VFHTRNGCQSGPKRRSVSGPDPGHRSYFPLLRSRPGRQHLAVPGITTRCRTWTQQFGRSTLTELCVRRSASCEYEPTAPKHHWSGWYAAYIVARQDGKDPEEAAKLASCIESAH